MSEALLTNNAPGTFSGPSPGTILRQAREGAGLHIGALAVSLKVPVKKIEALEADRLDLLPDAVFARALASSICRTLKIDPAPVLAGLPAGLRTTLKTDESSLNAAFNASGVAAPSNLAQQLSKPLVLAVLGLVAGAAVLLAVPNAITTSVSPEPTGAPPALTTPLKEGVDTVINAAASSAAPETSAIAAKPADGTTTATQNAAPNAPPNAPSLAAAMAQADVAPAPQSPGSPPADSLIVFTATGVSWVEVTDAAGVVQLRRTFAQGETLGVSGKLPLKVVVGRKDSVQVKVRGSAFDMASVSRDNVARFEVR